MTDRYPNLLSPLKVGNVVLRNRMMSPPSTPHFLQGVESYPTEKIITHFANRAKSGAAAVTINHLHQDEDHTPGPWAFDIPPKHFNMFDMNDYSCHNYVCQLLDAIHFYGAKAIAYVNTPRTGSWFEHGGPMQAPEGAGGPGMPPPPGDMPPMPGAGAPGGMPPMPEGDDEEMLPPPSADPSAFTREMMDAYIAEIVEDAKRMKKLGFDMASLHCAYRFSTHAAFFSPMTNHRTDEYGGSVANRARFLLEIYDALRKALGRGYPLECVISVSEPAGGYTVEDMCEFAKLAEGKIDILHLRNGEQDPQHPVGFTSSPENPCPTLDETAIVKRYCVENGINMIIGASGGFQDPDFAEKALADGKCDLIYMARAWICDPEYGQKVYEGRPEDITPCVRCNKCHVPNGVDMYRTLCSVNPLLGLEDKYMRMVPAETTPKKVAVVGGGPGGMKAAIYAADRGHDVTLFEASDKLGGQLKHADFADFKWPLRDHKNWLITQLEKRPVTVKMNTLATRELLEAGGYDNVIVAVGAAPNLPPIPGSDGDNVLFGIDAFGNADKLSDKIVVIGGGEIGVETAMYLCDEGKQVTVIEMLPALAADAPHAHYKSMLRAAWKSREPAFKGITRATVTGIQPDGVTYKDRNGEEHKVEAGSVVISVGTHSENDKAMALFSPKYRTELIGDCFSAGSIHKAFRSAYAAAMMI